MAIEFIQTQAFNALVEETKDDFIFLNMPSAELSCIAAAMACAAAVTPTAPWAGSVNHATSLPQIRSAFGNLVARDFTSLGERVPVWVDAEIKAMNVMMENDAIEALNSITGVLIINPSITHRLRLEGSLIQQCGVVIHKEHAYFWARRVYINVPALVSRAESLGYTNVAFLAQQRAGGESHVTPTLSSAASSNPPAPPKDIETKLASVHLAAKGRRLGSGQLEKRPTKVQRKQHTGGGCKPNCSNNAPGEATAITDNARGFLVPTLTCKSGVHTKTPKRNFV